MTLSTFLSTPFNPNLEFQITTTNVLPLSVCCAFVISAQEQVVQFTKGKPLGPYTAQIGSEESDSSGFLCLCNHAHT